jgi:hypothetical protein
MLRKLIGLIAFVLTSVGLIMQTVTEGMSILNTSFLIAILCFFTISLIEQFNGLKD